MTSAIAICFEAAPAMGKFTCPDEVHLDRRDAPEYAKALADELTRHGAVRESRNMGTKWLAEPAPKP